MWVLAAFLAYAVLGLIITVGTTFDREKPGDRLILFFVWPIIFVAFWTAWRNSRLTINGKPVGRRRQHDG